MRNRNRGTFEQTKAPLLFLAPNLIIFAVFIIVPAVSGLRMALFDWSILGDKHFVGWQNFVILAKDSMFWKTLVNTFVYVLAVVPSIVVCALLLGLIVAEKIPGIGVYRAFYYLPTMLSLIIVGISWRWILGFDVGIVNYMLRPLFPEGIPWLTEGHLAMGSLVLVTVWTRAGYFMMMFVGGLQSIPDTFYEAARIDGAGRFKIFRSITLPLLSPIFLVVAVLATIEAFKAYELIYVMTQGGPGSATKLLVQYAYQAAFQEDRLGYASAMSVVLLLIIGFFTFLQFTVRKGEFENE